MLKINKLAVLLSILLISLSFFGALFAKKISNIDSAQADTVAIVSIKGGIGAASAEYVVNAIAAANRYGDRMIVLKIDTPGGLSSSMRDMIKAILASRVPVIGYVTPQGARAASAGTYLLYACHLAAMAPGTNVGAATPVNLINPDANKKDDDKTKAQNASKNKAMNDAKAYIRSLAQLRQRNVAWAEEAVSQASSLTAKEALQNNVINFIASDTAALLQKINGTQIKLGSTTVKLNTSGIQQRVIFPGWRLRLLMTITNPSIVYLLLMIGFYGLFLEFTHPGAIIPGVLGGICLLLAVYALQMLPVNYVGLALLVLGLIFLVSEVFVTSAGVLAIGGTIALFIGSTLLFSGAAPGFAIPLSLIFLVCGFTLFLCLFLIYYVLRSQSNTVVSGAEAMIGQVATITTYRDQLRLRFQSELWQFECDQAVSEGTKVRIVAVRGAVLLVEKI